MAKAKKKHVLECVCGKKIIGFSEHHVKKNLEIHEKTSKFHEHVMKLLHKHKKTEPKKEEKEQHESYFG